MFNINRIFQALAALAALFSVLVLVGCAGSMGGTSQSPWTGNFRGQLSTTDRTAIAITSLVVDSHGNVTGETVAGGVGTVPGGQPVTGSILTNGGYVISYGKSSLAGTFHLAAHTRGEGTLFATSTALDQGDPTQLVFELWQPGS